MSAGGQPQEGGIAMVDPESVWADIEKIRQTSPLIHNITNYVVMNSTANALLALGASPVMAHAEEETAEMTELASALVVNIGTLSTPWVAGMERAVIAAREGAIPFVLDPVGAGATRFRTDTVHRLLSKGAPSVIRGNASEIMSLHTSQGETKGVDSTERSRSALEAGRYLAKRHGCAVSISGETDYLVSADERIAVSNGHPLMGRVTGMGCTASALTGAFLAVNPSALAAAAHAMAVMGICGEMAAEKAAGPGSLQLRFLDALYQLEKKQIEARLKVTHETL